MKILIPRISSVPIRPPDPPPPRQRSRQKKYEYDIRGFHPSVRPSELKAMLNEAAADGWRVIAIREDFVVLEREM